MKKSLLILVLAFTAIASLSAAEASLDAYKKTFSAELKKIEGDRIIGFTKLVDAYGAALDKLIKTSQAKGRLDDLLAAKKEQARLHIAKSVPKDVPAKLPDAINALRLNYFAVGGKIEADWNIRRTNLTRKYVAALERLTRKLTKDGKLEEALAAKNEKQRAGTILAEGESSLTNQNARKSVPKGRTANNTGIPQALKKGLILYHDFNALDRDKVRDQSASGYHGIVHGAKWVADGRGPANGAMQFDDENSYVDLGDILNDLEFPTSVSLWFKVHEFPKTWTACDAFESDKRIGTYYGFWVSVVKTHNVEITLGDGVGLGPGNRATFSGPRVEKGTWIHFAAIVSKEGIASMYINSEKVPTNLQGGAKVKEITHSKKPATIGRAFRGILDDVMLWNRALTDEEVKQVYTLTDGK